MVCDNNMNREKDNWMVARAGSIAHNILSEHWMVGRLLLYFPPLIRNSMVSTRPNFYVKDSYNTY